MVRVLVMAGSTRNGSLNAALAALAGKGLQALGAQVTLVSLKDYELPLYDGDLEAAKGPPASAQDLAQLCAEHDAFFIASPEYNASFSPLLKNALDWVSRVKLPQAPFAHKFLALGAASPGGFGGYRGLMQLRQCLELGFNALVVPHMVSIKQAGDAFDAHGQLKDAALTQQLNATLAALVQAAGKA